MKMPDKEVATYIAAKALHRELQKEGALTQPLRMRPNYGECHGPEEEQPSHCPALPRGADTPKESMAYSTPKHISRAWRNGNNRGEGFPVGNPNDDVNDLEHELGELVLPARSTDDIAVYRDRDGTLVGVGDAHGPWAVELPPDTRVSSRSRKALRASLISLGNQRKDLRVHIRPVLEHLQEKVGASREVFKALSPVQDLVGKMDAALDKAQRAIIRMDDEDQQEAAQVLYNMLKLEVVSHEKAMRELERGYGVR